MLLDFREKVRGSKPLKYSLITLICIPFVLVGVGSYFAGGTAAPVAQVNGEPIEAQQLERAYQQQRQQLARMFGGQIPDAFANETALREQALEQLITQQVLAGAVENQNFAVGDETLARAIRNEPSFQVDGVFDPDTYQTQLRSSGMSIPMFEQTFRDNTALNQFRTGISNTSFTLPGEAERLAALGRQTRTVEAIKFDFAKAKEGIEVTDDEVAAYFEENKENYNFPERAKIQYVELESSSVASNIEISDTQAQVNYDQNRDQYVVAAERSASHILLGSDEGEEDELISRLLELKARVEAGEDFAELAKENSTDVGSAGSGGNLGNISPGVMVPEFEAAVFALESEGSLSEPVVSQFGVHLIKLDQLTPEVVTPFEDVKEDIVSAMQEDEADREFNELRELLIESTFDNPGSLDPAADITGLEIKTSDWLDSETDAGELLSNPAVINAAFTPDVVDEGNNSELIVISSRHVMVLRVLEHEGPRPKELSDVNDEVVDSLKGQRASEMLSENVDAALESLATGSSAGDVAADNELAETFEQIVLNRQSMTFDRNIVSEIFSLPYPGDETITDKATLASGDALAFRLDSVETPDEDAPAPEPVADSEELTPTVMPVEGVLDAGVNTQLGATEFEVLLESLRAQADVDLTDAVSP